MRLLLPLIALVFCLAAGAYGYSRWRDAAPATNVEADIGAAHFSFPRDYARDEATAAGGLADRLALLAHFPDFGPLKRLTTKSGYPERPQDAVLVTISLKDDSLEPADRPSKLYSRFLTGETAAGPGGLVLRQFASGSPYDLEQLFVGPPDGRGFFARCPSQQYAGAIPADLCLSVFRDGSLDVELRFSPALLGQWEALFDGARELLMRVRRNKT